MRIQRTRRCGPIGTLRGVGGGGLANFHAMLPSPSAASRNSPAVSPGWRAACSARRATRTGNSASPFTPFATSVAAEGSGPGVHGSGPDRSRRRGRVEQHGRDVHSRDAVHEAVVGLVDHGEPVVLQALDQPQLPQRLGAVEALGEQPAGELAQLVVGAGARQRGVTHVVGEVEAWVVDPQGPSHLEPRVRELLAVARYEVQARLDVGAQVLVGRRRALEGHHRPDVHVRAALLLVEKRHVHGTQPLHMCLRHPRLPVRSRKEPYGVGRARASPRSEPSGSHPRRSVSPSSRSGARAPC